MPLKPYKYSAKTLTLCVSEQQFHIKRILLLAEFVLPYFRWGRQGVWAGERLWGVLMFLFPTVSTAWPPLIMASSTLHPFDPIPTTPVFPLVSATRTEEMRGCKMQAGPPDCTVQSYQIGPCICLIATCYITNTVVATFAGSKPRLSKLTILHDSETVPRSSNFIPSLPKEKVISSLLA